MVELKFGTNFLSLLLQIYKDIKARQLVVFKFGIWIRYSNIAQEVTLTFIVNVYIPVDK